MSVFQFERDGNAGALADRVTNSDSPAVRQQAAAALGRLDDPSEAALDALIDSVRTDAETGVRAAAIDALDNQGENALGRLVVAVAGFDPERTTAETVPTSAFVDALDADDAELRMAAASALGRRQATGATDALLVCLNDADPRVRVRAARACGEIADPAATDALASSLDDSVVEVRQEAGEALGRIGTDSAFEALRSLLDDEDEPVRWIAVDSLGYFEGVRPVDPLTDALTDRSALVRRAAVFSLVGVLSGTAAAHSHRTREAVLDRLEATNDERVVAALELIFEEGVRLPQRRNAVWLLGRIATEPERVLDPLAAALYDDDETLARFGATGLVDLGARAEPVLLDVLDDDDASDRTRALAVFALGKVGSERAKTRLETLLDETDDSVLRKRTLAALSKLGCRSIDRDPDSWVGPDNASGGS